MSPPQQAPTMIIAATMYHVISLVLQAGHRVLAQLARRPQVGHFMLYPRIAIFVDLVGRSRTGTLTYRVNQELLLFSLRTFADPLRSLRFRFLLRKSGGNSFEPQRAQRIRKGSQRIKNAIFRSLRVHDTLNLYRLSQVRIVSKFSWSAISEFS